MLGYILFFTVLGIIFILAVTAIIRGGRGIKTAKRSESTNRKIKAGYTAVSVVHIAAGSVVVLCYLIVACIYLATIC